MRRFRDSLRCPLLTLCGRSEANGRNSRPAKPAPSGLASLTREAAPAGGLIDEVAPAVPLYDEGAWTGRAPSSRNNVRLDTFICVAMDCHLQQTAVERARCRTCTSRRAPGPFRGAQQHRTKSVDKPLFTDKAGALRQARPYRGDLLATDGGSNAESLGRPDLRRGAANPDGADHEPVAPVVVALVDDDAMSRARCPRFPAAHAERGRSEAEQTAGHLAPPQRIGGDRPAVVSGGIAR